MHMQSTLLAPISPSPSSCIPPFRRSLRLKASISEAPPSTGTQHKLNKYSSCITQPKSQVSEEDMGKPQIGVSSVWYEGNTCNMHLLTLSEAVKGRSQGCWDDSLQVQQYWCQQCYLNGHQGHVLMCYSLQSRDLIADSIETVMSAQWYDGNISIPGCDKNIPGTIMTMGRL